MANFVSYDDAKQLMAKIGNKFSALAGAYTPKGNTTFAGLPATPTPSMVGNAYNVTDAFTTDARFVEGAGKEYGSDSNVVVVDNSTYSAVTPVGSEDPTTEGWYELDSSTGKYVLSEDTTVDPLKTYYEKTVIIQYDVLGGFVDLSDINDKIDNLYDLISGGADEFDPTQPYSPGDVVIYNNKLYRFITNHTPGDPWDPTEVELLDVEKLINEAKASVENLLTDEFNASNAYAIGDVVTYQDGLYKFKAVHTAGDPWDPTEVDSTQMVDLITSASDPDPLTPGQIADLEDLLD